MRISFVEYFTLSDENPIFPQNEIWVNKFPVAFIFDDKWYTWNKETGCYIGLYSSKLDKILCMLRRYQTRR